MYTHKCPFGCSDLGGCWSGLSTLVPVTVSLQYPISIPMWLGRERWVDLPGGSTFCMSPQELLGLKCKVHGIRDNQNHLSPAAFRDPFHTDSKGDIAERAHGLTNHVILFPLNNIIQITQGAHCQIHFYYEAKGYQVYQCSSVQQSQTLVPIDGHLHYSSCVSIGNQHDGRVSHPVFPDM